MARFKLSAPLTVAMILLVPAYEKVLGVESKTFPDIADGIPFNGNFRTFGGTERDVNGVYSIEDTAIVETWYDPAIKSDCRIAIRDSGAVYEIINEPENVELRNQYLKFRVRRVKGGA